ncbi:MAG: ribbon-helix-helix protein, CopG family [Clostridiales bacterium]|nr:ribbon-helix-helix protein, CopG family [Clostridiales bacterium]
MPNMKKVIVALPEELLARIDGAAAAEDKSRSELVREALHLLLENKRREEIREALVTGYEVMGSLNLELAEEGFAEDADTYFRYEESLASAERV